MPAFSTPWVLTPQGLWSEATLELTDAGTVVTVHPQPQTHATWLEGILLPGMVNAHTHLELSHLHGLVQGHEGFAGFARRLVPLRSQTPEAQRQQAATQELHQAWQAGTAALGDIANTPDAFPAAAASPAYVHHFIELFDLNPARATEQLALGRALRSAAPGAATLTPHAPFSVSRRLLDLIYAENRISSARMSIHLLESTDELAFFENTPGNPLQQLFSQWAAQPVLPPGAEPLAHLLAGLPPVPLLAVHLTHASAAHIGLLEQLAPQPYYCLCPRSNLYLHDALPPVHLLPWQQGRVCLGTDSLASGPDLNVLQEAITLQQAFPDLSTETLMKALTLSGAQALGADHMLGHFSPGLAPGVVQLAPVGPNGELLPHTQARWVVPFTRHASPHDSN